MTKSTPSPIDAGHQQNNSTNLVRGILSHPKSQGLVQGLSGAVKRDLRSHISNFYYLVKLNNYHSHFAVELLLLTIMFSVSVGNIFLKANLRGASAHNRSLLFSYIEDHPELNPDLAESIVSVEQRSVGGLPKQVLGTAVAANVTTPDATAPLPTLSGSALLKPNPVGNFTVYGKDIEVYQVRGGDTVAAIAANYNISERTIIDENGLPNSALIKPGQSLRILPVSGVKHVVQTGETLDDISKKYGVDMETVIEYNEIEIEEHIFPGEEIIIPNGVKPAPPTPQRQQYLADLKKEDYQKVAVPADYRGSDAGFIWPLPAAHRLSQKFWSRHRAIDIPCRDCQVVAAADGIVEIAGWQTGYGNTILLNHGNGMRTRYGHGSKLLVSAGDQVVQGQAVMISGSTGRSTGPHLHFEIKQGGTLLDPMKLLER